MSSASRMVVVLFPNSQTAIQAERVLHAQGLAAKLIPIPRQFSTDCGLALRLPEEERERAQAVLGQAGIRYRAIHKL